mgnify:CR=1 FL=1
MIDTKKRSNLSVGKEEDKQEAWIIKRTSLQVQTNTVGRGSSASSHHEKTPTPGLNSSFQQYIAHCRLVSFEIKDHIIVN